jgi:hypothetical protein
MVSKYPGTIEIFQLKCIFCVVSEIILARENDYEKSTAGSCEKG